MDYDIVIAGAGPAGLCLARTLSGHGLRIAVVEQQKQEALEKPAFDGREIALTQHSARFMRQLGVWERIKVLDPVALAPLKDLAAAFQIRSIPTIAVIREGVMVFRESGALPASALNQVSDRSSLYT